MLSVVMRRYNLQSRDTCLALRWKSIGRRRRRKKKEAQLLSWIRRNKEREMDGAKGKKSKKDCAGLSPGWTGQAVCYNVTLTGPTSDCSYSLLLLSFFFFFFESFSFLVQVLILLKEKEDGAAAAVASSVVVWAARQGLTCFTIITL